MAQQREAGRSPAPAAPAARDALPHDALAYDTFLHDALIFDSPEQLTTVAAPFLADGLAAGDTAAIAAGPGTTQILLRALDHDPRIQVIAGGASYGARTAASIAEFRRLSRRCAHREGARVRVIGETDFGRTDRQRLEWQRYEAVINNALAGWPLWGLCVFDAAHQPEAVLEAARQTHPCLRTADGSVANPRFTDPADYLRALPTPREPLEDTPPRLAVPDVVDFIGLRHAVAAELTDVRAPSTLVEDFLLAVDEMTSNALRHGSPPVDLRLWTTTDRIVCTITDAGQGWSDPFAGYGPAHGEDLSRGGMGLWLARQLCDHVDLVRTDHDVRVRLTTRLR